jgi:phytoene synthase
VNGSSDKPRMDQLRQARTNLAAVRASARANAIDRYYAALFAPSGVRDDLISLAAFVGEIEHVGRVVGEPAIGEIRIAWWRDALLEGARDATGNPVLDAFAETVRRYQLKNAAIADFLSTHADALYPGPPKDDAELARRLRAIDATPFIFAAQILGLDAESASDLFKAAGRAAGMARIARELPYTLMRDRLPLPEARSPNPFEMPQDWRPQIAWLHAEAAQSLAAVRDQLKGKPRAFLTTLLPLALVEPNFRALQSSRHDPAHDVLEIAPLARLWRVARVHWTGRL